MQVFYKTREQPRNAAFGVLVDNGKQAGKGKRYARSIEATASNNAMMVATSPTFDRVIPVFTRGRNKL